jgi:hypothetical protein
LVGSEICSKAGVLRCISIQDFLCIFPWVIVGQLLIRQMDRKSNDIGLLTMQIEFE